MFGGREASPLAAPPPPPPPPVDETLIYSNPQCVNSLAAL